MYTVKRKENAPTALSSKPVMIYSAVGSYIITHNLTLKMFYLAS